MRTRFLGVSKMTDFSVPGVPGAYNRGPFRPNDTGLVFVEKNYLQGAELNELQFIQNAKHGRIARLSAADGDRQSGGGIQVDLETGRVQLEAGAIYAAGDVRPVLAAVLENVPMQGTIDIGVRLVTELISPEDDDTLKGLEPGTPAEGEDGAWRTVEYVSWGFDGDGQEGALYAVYRLQDGRPLDTSDPVRLSTTNALLADYDRQANGNYIADGCSVTAIGFDPDGALVLDIGAGAANIYGYKYTRKTALRDVVPQHWNTVQVDGESHTFTDQDGGLCEITLARAPLDSVVQVLVEKEMTDQITRGASAGGADSFAESSVVAVLEVWQGETVYRQGTDYTWTGSRIDWLPGGVEPVGGSQYEAKIRYRDAVSPVAQTSRSLTVSGGVDGGEIIVTYLAKLPRIDLVGLNDAGEVVYITGVSAERPSVPPVPTMVLKLAEVHNDFDGLPEIVNNGTFSYPYDEISALFQHVRELTDLVALNRLQTEITQSEPAAKYGMFVDPFDDDRFRDPGSVQDAACANGVLMLPIDTRVHDVDAGRVHMLDFVWEKTVDQPLATVCKIVNRFANATPIPADLQLSPNVDFWSETRTQWASDQTRRIDGGTRVVRGWQNRTRQEVSNRRAETRMVDQRRVAARFLRSRPVSMTIDGFGGGEDLAELTFDGVNITPAGVSADAAGEIEHTYVIPPNTYTAGTKLVTARGAGGSTATATFVGGGEIVTQTMQRTIFETVTTVRQIQRDTDPRGQIWRWGIGNAGHCCGGEVTFCAIGNPETPCVAQLRPVDDTGYPLDTVLDEMRINMGSVVLGVPHRITFARLPYFSDTDRVALVILTSDPGHAIRAAALGGFDAERQRWVTEQPYTVGVEVESSNGSTWAPVHDSDLTFSVSRARFNTTTKTVTLGPVDLDNASDLRLQAAFDLPTAETSIGFSLTLEDGQVVPLTTEGGVDLGGYRSGRAILQATLRGETFASPRLYQDIQVVAGRIKGAATYVSRAFEIKGSSRVPVRVKQLLPSGASAKVFVRDAAGEWVELAYTSGQVLEVGGWIDALYDLTDWPALGETTAVKIEFTGGPAARPYFTDLRAVGTGANI
ncbi:virulence-associated protein [Roseibium sp. TrichSKD4]|nr:virulence-associated protein [Roseibium sp. TrichSKD4]